MPISKVIFNIKRVLAAFSAVFLLLLLIAYLSQNMIHKAYDEDFNAERKELGIYEIDSFNKLDLTKWNKHYLNSIALFRDVILNREIANITTYSNDSIYNKPYHLEKRVYFGTHLFFWKNFYAGEIDEFINPIDGDKHIRLTTTYLTDAMNQPESFYADIDTIDRKHRHIFDCGTFLDGELIEDEEPEFFKGNITIQRANEILIDWGLQ
ncbi:MAG: hypothetical protein ACPGLV_04610 [Bacteroidia bacterium]